MLCCYCVVGVWVQEVFDYVKVLLTKIKIGLLFFSQILFAAVFWVAVQKLLIPVIQRRLGINLPKRNRILAKFIYQFHRRVVNGSLRKILSNFKVEVVLRRDVFLDHSPRLDHNFNI